MAKSRWSVYAFGPCLLLACGPDGAPDGAPCEADKDCASERCVDHEEGDDKYTTCDGSRCNADDDCEDGWACRTYKSGEASFLGILDGDEYTSVCTPVCGACPERFTCGESETGWCYYDDQWAVPELTIEVPEVIHDGQEVTLKATATSKADIAIERVVWEFEDGSTAEGTSVQHVFGMADWYSSADYRVNVTARDVESHTTGTFLHIDRCLVAGDACYVDESVGPYCCSNTCTRTEDPIDDDRLGACE